MAMATDLRCAWILAMVRSFSTLETALKSCPLWPRLTETNKRYDLIPSQVQWPKWLFLALPYGSRNRFEEMYACDTCQSNNHRRAHMATRAFHMGIVEGTVAAFSGGHYAILVVCNFVCAQSMVSINYIRHRPTESKAIIHKKWLECSIVGVALIRPSSKYKQLLVKNRLTCPSLYIYMSIHKYICNIIHTYMHVHVHAWMSCNAHIFTYTNVYTCINICI